MNYAQRCASFLRSVCTKRPVLMSGLTLATGAGGYTWYTSRGRIDIRKNDLPINGSFFDPNYRISLVVFNGLVRIMESSEYAYRLRLGLSRIPFMENALMKLTQRACVAQYHQTLKNTEAYKEFIGDKNQHYKIFSDVDITNKDNYIKKYADEPWKLIKNGMIPNIGQIDMSSGTTGKPTIWYRGPKECDFGQTIMTCVKSEIYGKQPIICINTYGMAIWGTGTLASKIMGKLSLYHITGSDVDKVCNILAEIQNAQLNSRPIVIFGLPTMVKYITDKLQENQFSLDKFNLTAVVGGEGISEAMRDYIMHNGFGSCFSCYGATDLDVMVGSEEDFNIELRKLCHDNAALRKKLFGDDCESVPMIFTIDPMNYYPEQTSDGRIIFTCARNNKCSPRIRYDVQDKGMVINSTELKKILAEHQIKIQPKTGLPLLCIFGRKNYGISYHGTNLSVLELQTAVGQDKYLSDKIKDIGINLYEDNKLEKHLEYFVELKSGVDPETITVEKINQSLSTVNPDFGALLANGQHIKQFHMPQIITFKENESPMALHSHANPNSKTQRVFSMVEKKI